MISILALIFLGIGMVLGVTFDEYWQEVGANICLTIAFIFLVIDILVKFVL